MGYSLTPAYHLLSTVIVIPEDTEELAGGQWQGNREHRLEIPTFIIKWMELIDVSFLPEDMKKPYKRLVLQRLLWLR